MPQAMKTEEKTFETVDIVALYLGKTFSHKQMKEIRKIVEFLVGTSDGFGYENVAVMNEIRRLLDQKLQWLSSVRYTRDGFEAWIKNIIRNHGATQILEK